MALPQIGKVNHTVRELVSRDAELMAHHAVLLLDLIEDRPFAIGRQT